MSGDETMKKGAKGALPVWHTCAKTAMKLKLIDKDGWKQLIEAYEKGMGDHYAAIDAELKEAKKKAEADAPKKASKAATVAELQKQMKEMQAKIDAVAK